MWLVDIDMATWLKINPSLDKYEIDRCKGCGKLYGVVTPYVDKDQVGVKVGACYECDVKEVRHFTNMRKTKDTGDKVVRSETSFSTVMVNDPGAMALINEILEENKP